MRVLLFGERLAPPADEGIKNLTLRLAAALRSLGDDVLTLTTGGADWLAERVTNVPADRLLRSPELARAIAMHRPDAVLYVPTASLTLASGFRSATLRRYAGGAPVALIATQGRLHSGKVRFAARLAGTLGRRPDLCAALSLETLHQAKALGWRAASVRAGVDLDRFSPVTDEERRHLRAYFNLPQNAFVLLHAGHLNRRRGVTDLLTTAGIALPVLAASTSTPPDLALGEELSRGGVRVLTDYIPNIADLYRAADAYLFPTPPDPNAPSSIDTPLSVLEALACELPVISTRFGALPELFKDQPGVRFYAGSDELRAAVLHLCSRPRTYPTRALVESFGWPSVATQILTALVHP